VKSLASWIQAHGLSEPWRPLLATTTAWIESAAPAWASEEERTLACMDLGTCFFILDDGDDPRAPSDLARISAGRAPEPTRPLQRAFASLFARMGERGSIAHFLAVRHQFAHALDVRQAMREGGGTLDVATYLSLREITIYFEPWLALWEVLGGYVLTAEQRSLVAPVFDPANRWQALENDRVSVDRDLRDGTPNLVALLADEEGCSLGAAALEIQARAVRELEAYDAAIRALRASAPAPEVLRYLATLEAGIDGAIRHHGGADPARYAVDYR
jgi:hypothetical protein